jgi:hypothetical protein
MLATIKKYLMLFRWFHVLSETEQLEFLCRRVMNRQDGARFLIEAFSAMTIVSLLCNNYRHIIIVLEESHKDAQTYQDCLRNVTHATKITDKDTFDFAESLLATYRVAKDYGL